MTYAGYTPIPTSYSAKALAAPRGRKAVEKYHALEAELSKAIRGRRSRAVIAVHAKAFADFDWVMDRKLWRQMQRECRCGHHRNARMIVAEMVAIADKARDARGWRTDREREADIEALTDIYAHQYASSFSK